MLLQRPLDLFDDRLDLAGVRRAGDDEDVGDGEDLADPHDDDVGALLLGDRLGGDQRPLLRGGIRDGDRGQAAVHGHVITTQCRAPGPGSSVPPPGAPVPSIERPVDEPLAQVGGRDVEARDRDPLEAPSLAGRLGLGVTGSLDRRRRWPGGGCRRGGARSPCWRRRPRPGRGTAHGPVAAAPRACRP